MNPETSVHARAVCTNKYAIGDACCNNVWRDRMWAVSVMDCAWYRGVWLTVIPYPIVWVCYRIQNKPMRMECMSKWLKDVNAHSRTLLSSLSFNSLKTASVAFEAIVVRCVYLFVWEDVEDGNNLWVRSEFQRISGQADTPYCVTR